ncbi:transcriptional regulator [Sporosarcina sp. P18a]|uniref:helix-turn-helix transcriptional regulator n=1 Tax=Sporosarcina sp. P18a TaxID=2048259 RepID=UPI000C166134|nr:helix-turn-helix domain-containing protein [Sporosarcina sp. P18a]PIC80514.1 transcriptional regulator [Sporosarcina sp. P18a]
MKQWNLIRLRNERGLKQKDMAKLLDITVESYGLKERGQHQFRMDEMFSISHFFHIPIEDIFLPRNFGNNEVCGPSESQCSL